MNEVIASAVCREGKHHRCRAGASCPCACHATEVRAVEELRRTALEYAAALHDVPARERELQRAAVIYTSSSAARRGLRSLEERAVALCSRLDHAPDAPEGSPGGGMHAPKIRLILDELMELVALCDAIPPTVEE